MWTELFNSGDVTPGGRSSHSCNVIDNRLYVFGGENTPRIPVNNTLYCYDLEKSSWVKLNVKGQAPCARIAHAAAVVEKKLFIFGGRTGIDMGEGSLNDLHCFNTETLTWSEIKCQGQVPSARSYHAMVSRGQQLYLFGGCGAEGRLNDLYSYDSVSNTWKSYPTHQPIRGRGGPGLVATDTTIFVVSGFAGEETNDMYRFDLKNESWMTLNPDPVFSPRSVFGIGCLGDFLVVFGGEVKPSELGHAGAGGFTNETWVYDTRSQESKWIKITAEGQSPPARGWFSAAPSGEEEMVIYGGNAQDNSRLSDLWKLKLAQ